jgi:segregation and condensation protein B
MTSTPSLPSHAANVLAVEALVIAAGRPVLTEEVRRHLPGVGISSLIDELKAFWEPRGVNFTYDGKALRAVVSQSVAIHLRNDEEDGKRLTAAGMETLSVIAMHQPVTLNDIERFRGVKLSRGIMEALISADLVRLALRRTDSGRAAVYMTTETFLAAYGLGSLADLPRPDEVADLVNPPSDASDAE